MSKYAKLIFPDEKKVNEEKKADAIDDAQNEVTNAIYGAKRAVKASAKSLKVAMGSVPFSPVNVIEAQFNLDAAKESVVALEAMEKEMF